MTTRAFGVGNELGVDAMGNRVERILDHVTERRDPFSSEDGTVFAGAQPTTPTWSTASAVRFQFRSPSEVDTLQLDLAATSTLEAGRRHNGCVSVRIHGYGYGHGSAH